jgi:hypothetical protein
MRRSRGALLLALLLALVATDAEAQDRWSAPHAGVQLLTRRAPGPLRIRAVLADLCTPGLRVRATRPDERGQTLTSFAERTRATVAINGDFYATGFRPVGLAMGDGRHWPGTRDDGRWGLVAFGEGRAEVPAYPADPPFEWIHEAIGGVPQLVLDGTPVSHYGSAFCAQRHPRSAIGLSEDQRTLILVAVDGRSDHSVGMTCPELAELLAELGAWQAINLDGGGSTALFVDGLGVVNAPSDGSERAVANHLALVGTAEGVDACPPRVRTAAWSAAPPSDDERALGPAHAAPPGAVRGSRGSGIAFASLGGAVVVIACLTAARRARRV